MPCRGLPLQTGGISKGGARILVNNMKASAEALERERSRIADIYRRREIGIEKDLYAPWQPAVNLMVAERKRVAAAMLHKMGKFPQSGDKCLEIGCGRLGWLADLLSWGMREKDLHGIELDADRVLFAQQALPNSDLRIGDAAELPWPDNFFDLVVLSTVFSSVLDKDVRITIADETQRVLSCGGAVLWYDLAANNPRNPDVHGINSIELKHLFPNFQISARSVTLAPPIARMTAGTSVLVATVLNSLPFLRTHLLAVLIRR